MSKFVHAIQLSLVALAWIWKTAATRGNGDDYNHLDILFTRCARCETEWSNPDVVYCRGCLDVMSLREQEETQAMKTGMEYHENYHEPLTDEGMHRQASWDRCFSHCPHLSDHEYIEQWMSGYRSVDIGICASCGRTTGVQEVADMLLCSACITPPSNEQQDAWQQNGRAQAYALAAELQERTVSVEIEEYPDPDSETPGALCWVVRSPILNHPNEVYGNGHDLLRAIEDVAARADLLHTKNRK